MPGPGIIHARTRPNPQPMYVPRQGMEPQTFGYGMALQPTEPHWPGPEKILKVPGRSDFTGGAPCPAKSSVSAAAEVLLDSSGRLLSPTL